MSFPTRKWISNLIILLFFFMENVQISKTQTYEVAEIDCAIGHGGKELLTARLRKPDGFRGIPIFADDRGGTYSIPYPPSHDPLIGPNIPTVLLQHLNPDSPCQIYPDPLDSSGRVYVLKVMDFTKCGVLKRDGFINVRVWFPQLPGVVMLSDQEVIIMCKPPQPTILQSKAAGFAGSIPKGPRVTGIVEEHPGQLEYEVALFRETASSNSGRSVVSSGSYVTTGSDSQELPVDQAVPIGTRLQLRAKISPTSAWQHAKLLDVSVSPDPKNPIADGSVALVKNGCRNPDLASIIPKQPYRYKDRSNEVVLDFEAFLLSNMGDRNTLWLHTQIKACMEQLDCESEVCIMDIYQPSSYGRKRRDTSPNRISTTATVIGQSGHNETVAQYSSPLLRHWTTIVGPTEPEQESSLIETSKRGLSPTGLHRVDSNQLKSAGRKSEKSSLDNNQNIRNGNGTNTKFGDNIGFSVIMPPDYYRSNPSKTAVSAVSTSECRGWILSSFLSMLGAIVAGIVACLLNFRFKKFKLKGKELYSYEEGSTPTPSFTSSGSNTTLWTSSIKSAGDANSERSSTSSTSSCKAHLQKYRHQNSKAAGTSKYARDPSIYRP